MGNVEFCTPFPPRPILEQKPQVVDDEQWRNIKNIIAAIAVPKPTMAGHNDARTSISEDSTPVDESETARLLMPKVVDNAATASNAYGTFNIHASESEKEVVPLHPTTLLTSAALTPIYLILMLLPLLPFWIFAGFLVYVAATEPISEIRITLIALAFLLPFNVIGTVAIVRFALGEREKALTDTDLEAAAPSPVSVRSNSSFGSEKKRLWRPSMQFVLHGARREGRRL